MFLLLSNPALKHFTLPKTHDFLDNFVFPLKNRVIQLKNSNTNFRIFSVSYDVKNMYTELPHKKILDALYWLLDESKKTRYGRHQSLYITKSGRNGVSYHRHARSVAITFEQLILFAKFDLENVYFTLGKTILKQIIGIPMGSPLSPSLAIIICAHAEHIFSLSILDFKYFFATRYMDDLHSAIIILGNKMNKALQAYKTIYDMEHIYPDTLTLEKTGTGSTDFLESTITYTKQDISVRYYSKNRDSLHLNNAKLLKFYRFQPYHSYRPSSQIRGTLVGTFLRLIYHSDSATSAFPSAIELIKELRLLDYPRHILKKVTTKLDRRHPHALWLDVFRYLTYKKP